MRLEETELPGVFAVHPAPLEDERGLFARVFDEEIFAARGLVTAYPQHSLSHNHKRGTLRGLHWQEAPHAEAKLVRCVAGRLWDVALDLRPRSPTYRRHVGCELSAGNRVALYLPAGVAHGFLTLTDATEVLYLISAPYTPAAARGARWDDPAFGIGWPEPVQVISERDGSWPDYQAKGEAR